MELWVLGAHTLDLTGRLGVRLEFDSGIVGDKGEDERGEVSFFSSVICWCFPSLCATRDLG